MAAPTPLIRPVSQPYWTSLRQGRVVLQHCCACDRFIHYPRSFCPYCECEDLDWREVSGRGTLISYTLAHRPVSKDFGGLPSQMLVIVELESQVRIASTLVGDATSIAVNAAVQPVFDHDSVEGLTLLRFALAPERMASNA